MLASNYSIDSISLLQGIPDPLKILLHKIGQQHYEELYEPEADGTTSLQDALNEVLEAFRSNNQTSHLRYVWMALILTLVVEPTIEYYQPNNSLPKDTVNLMVLWLINTINKLNNSEVKTTKFSIDEILKKISETRNSSFYKELTSLQIIAETLNVFNNAILVLDRDRSKEALLEILDDCLEGYAVFPGSSGRRELFDWWLLEVVPASWKLLPPKSFYVVEGLQNKEEIRSRQIEKLEQISIQMRL